MKLGIVGTGTIVEEVLPVLQQVKGLSCYGICGTKRSEAKAEKLKEQYQMQLAVSDYEKLLDSEIDTVYIAVPNLLHFEMAKEAVLRGKHVIVEKPMTANERQAEELCALAKKQGVFLFEAITTRYQSNYQFIKEQLPTIGKIKMAVCNFSQYSRKYDRFQNGENIPVFDAKQAGGALMDLNLYNIQYLEGLFGEPQSVHYTANMEKGIDTSGVAILSYPGFQAVAIGAKDCQGQPEYRIEGSEGYIAQNSPCNVCGAVTGGVAALSCKYVEGDGGHTSPTLMQKVKTYIRLVKTEYGSEQCKMLKPQFFSKEERCYQTILRIAEVLDRVDQMEA